MTVMVVVLSLAEHYLPTRRSFGHEMPMAWSRITLRYKLTGREVCECIPEPGEQMTASQLSNCVTTLLAHVLVVPRICIRLCWMPTGGGEFDVEVILHLLSSWVDDVFLYDECFDANSDYWDENGLLLGPGMMPCLCCGDSTQDIDLTDVKRSELCYRCEPCAMCCNCRCMIEGRPVCMACVENPHELSCLSEKQLRWYGAFAQDIMPFEQLKHLGRLR